MALLHTGALVQLFLLFKESKSFAPSLAPIEGCNSGSAAVATAHECFFYFFYFLFVICVLCQSTHQFVYVGPKKSAISHPLTFYSSYSAHYVNVIKSSPLYTFHIQYLICTCILFDLNKSAVICAVRRRKW